jgi:hypothetical protein
LAEKAELLAQFDVLNMRSTGTLNMFNASGFVNYVSVFICKI